MGGRGAKSSTGAGTGAGAGVGVISGTNIGGIVLPPNIPNVQNQAPDPDNTLVTPNGINQLTQLSDSQLTQLFNRSKTVDMPNHLSDVSDITQKFVYTAGLNEKPTVIPDSQWNQYLQQNNIKSSDILARSTGGANYVVNGTNINLSPTQVTDLTKYGQLTYVGGKHGGMVYGAGTYFDKNGGRPTGYSNGATMIAVLSPNARTITKNALINRTAQWARTHPQFASAVGSLNNSNLSVYALAQGFNVITDNAGSYHNIIDRSAMVVKQSNY